MGKEKKRALRLHGGLPSMSHLPPALQKAKKFLDELPVDVAYSVVALANEIGVSIDHLKSTIMRLGEDYRYPEGNAYGYGNPKTVKLKKEGFYESQTESES